MGKNTNFIIFRFFFYLVFYNKIMKIIFKGKKDKKKKYSLYQKYDNDINLKVTVKNNKKNKIYIKNIFKI